MQTIRTHYKHTVSMSVEQAEDYMNNGKTLAVYDFFNRKLGYITPRDFKNTARYSTAWNGCRVMVANFIKRV